MTEYAAGAYGPQNAVTSVPVVIANDQGSILVSQLPQQTFGLKAAVFATGLAVSGTTVIIAGVSLKSVTVYGFSWSISNNSGAAGAFQAALQDSTGASPFDVIQYNVITNVGSVASPRSAIWIPGGLAFFPIARGIQVTNQGNACAAAGTVFYTQQ